MAVMFGPGTRFGPYEVLSSLFEGDSDAAYVARDHDHARDVVLHVVTVDFAADPERLHVFERDARIALTLDHPNILTFYEIGTDPHTAYVVVEPVDGETLRALLDRGALSLSTAARLTTDVARALRAGHRKQLVHGDLSADTVVVTSNGAKVLEFGLGALTRQGPPRSDASAFAALAWQLTMAGVRHAIGRGAPMRRRVAWTAIAVAALAVVVGVAVSVMRGPTAPAQPPQPATAATTLPIETPAAPVVPSPVVSQASGVVPQASEAAARAAATLREAPAGVISSPAPPPPVPVTTLPPPAPAPPVSERDRAEPTTEASVRPTEFDINEAANLLQRSTQGNGGDEVEALYIRGLIDAREAFRLGGSTASLVPVASAITALAKISQGRPGRAEIARLVLQAASAAAQTERDEMRLYLEVAGQMESLQHEAGQPGAPLVSAAEAAGDLWLQVHDYEKAQRAYMDALERDGATLRILYGLARSVRGLNDSDAACSAYRQLLVAWGQRPGSPPEISEARTYAAACAPPR